MGNVLEIKKQKQIKINSSLPADVQEMLKDAALNGFKNDTLKLHNKQINDHMMLELCQWILQLQSKIRIISMQWNPMTSAGVNVLFNALKAYKIPIQEIYMRWNGLDDGCAKVIGEFIQSSNHIKKLNIGNNKITDYGVMVLSAYIVGNTSLSYFGVQENIDISDESVPYLVDMVTRSSLTILHIYGTSISIPEKERVLDLVSLPFAQRDIPELSSTEAVGAVSLQT